MQVNIHEAKTQLSHLLELVEQGETVVIARNGKPIAQLIMVAKPAGFPFGIASNDPRVPEGDGWWQPMTDEECDDWVDGK